MKEKKGVKRGKERRRVGIAHMSNALLRRPASASPATDTFSVPMHLPSRSPFVLPASAAPHGRQSTPSMRLPPHPIHSTPFRPHPVTSALRSPTSDDAWSLEIVAAKRFAVHLSCVPTCDCSGPLYSFDSRPSRERERATMILRRVGGRADIFFDKFSQQHVIKTLSARRPSRPSAIFSS